MTADTKQHTVTASAQHVSYDLSGILIGDCNIKLAEPALAIMRMQDAWMMHYRGMIATDLSAEDNGTYTGRCHRQDSYGRLPGS